MTSSKKSFILPYTLAFCTVGFIALTGCQSNQEDIYIDEDSYSAQTATYSPYTEEYLMVEEDATLPCYQVKNGQILDSSSNVVHSADGSSHPCAFIDQAAGVKNVSQNAEKASCPCKKSATGTQTPCMKAALSNSVADSKGCGADGSSTNKVSARANTVVNIETPARCEITKNEASVISSIPLKQDAFKLIPMDKSDPLPRFEVNGYTFKNIPLDLAIQNLVSEADIRVYSDDALFPEVSGDDIRGELSSVIDELASTGDVFYRYDAAKKQLILSRWARFTMQVPGGRVGMYTVLDALRGANITNLQPDFGSNEIYMRINFENQKIISSLVDAIKQSPNLLLFDIQVYRMVKSSKCSPMDWQKIVQDYGVTRINSSVNGIVGRVLSTGRQTTRQTLLEMLRQYGSVNLISEGVAIMPNGWKVRFDIGQCAKAQVPEQALSMLFQSNILSNNRAESNIALDTASGEITSFHTVYGIDDTLNIIGVPGSVFNPDWGDSVEYIITLQPKMVKLVK